MTYREMTQLDKAIQAQSALIEVLESMNDVSALFDAKKKHNELCCKRAAEINRLPIETLEGSCLYLRLCKNFSWRKIALNVGGKNTEDSIKKMCYRFSW